MAEQKTKDISDAELLAEQEKIKADAEAAAAKEAEEQAAAAKDKGTKLRAVERRIRNPVTGAMFHMGQETVVLDLETSSKEGWTRAQVEAGVLVIVK